MNEDPVRLTSVTFREEVRLPGSSMTGRYIPAVDYPLTYLPALGLIEATLRKGVNPMQNQDGVRWYPIANVKDMSLAPDSVPVHTSVKERGGVLVVPEGRMRATPGGGFERITEEDEEPRPHPLPMSDAAEQEEATRVVAKLRKKPGPKPKPKAPPMPMVDPAVAQAMAGRRRMPAAVGGGPEGGA